MSPLIGSFPVAGPPIQVDDTDKMAVSLYGKGTAAGDTAVSLVSAAIGQLKATLYRSTGAEYPAVAPTADAWTSATALAVFNQPGLFNGASFDRSRNNEALTVAASAARTAELVSADQVNYNGRGILLIVNVTARAAATTLTPKFQYKDPVSGEYKLAWTAAAAINTADDTFAYLLYPHTIPAVAVYTEHVDIVLPRTYRIVVTPNDANSVTYSVAVVHQL